jgi:hypothetical protein
MAFDPISLAVYAGLAVATWVAGRIIQDIQKRRTKPKPQTFDSSALPSISEATPLPVLFGTMRITPNLVWYWLQNGGAQEVFATGYNPTTGPYTYGTGAFKYGGNFHFILCAVGRTADHSVVTPTYTNQITEFWVAEKRFFTASASEKITSAANFYGTYLNAPDFFGGLKKGGGVDGYFAYHDGETNTAKPGVYDAWESWKNLLALAASLGESGYDERTPDYRYTMGVCLTEFFFGESPYLPPLSFVAQCLPNYGNSTLDSRISNTLGPDANPAAVIYSLLTNSWFGLGLPTSQVDLASFHAAGQTLNTEGFGLTVFTNEDTSPREVIDRVLEHIDAVLWEDHASGTIKIKLIREDYTVASLLELTESNVVAIDSYKAASWEDTYNLVRIAYSDRDKLYKETYLGVHDQANFTFQSNKIRVIDLKFPYCMTATVARKILDRELRNYSLPKRALRLVATREAMQLTPGQVFRFTWPDFDIEDMVFRVVSLDLGTLDKNQVTIDAVQDVFDAVNNTHANDEDDDLLQTDLDRPAPVQATPIGGRNIGVIELPFYFIDKIEDENLFVDPNRISKIMFCFTPTISEATIPGTGYEVKMAINGGDVNLHEANLTFHEYAQVDTDYPFDTDSYDTSVGLIIKNVSNPAILQDATEDEIREEGKNIILVNGEFLAFETVTDNLDGTYTLENVWRELIDTSPRDLLEDDVVVFLLPGTLKNISKSIFRGDEAISLVARSYNGVQLSDEETYSNFDLDKRPLLPAPPQNLKVRFDTMDPNTQDAHARTVVQINTDVQADFTWNQRNRLAGEVVRGDDASTTPEDGTLYEIQGKHYYDNTWTTLETAIAAGTSGSAWVNELLPFGDTELRVQAYRDIDITGVTDTRYSFDGPTIRFDNASFRQLLKSPNGGNLSTGWTVVSGTWDHNFTPTSGGAFGGVFAGNTVIKQTTTGTAEYVMVQEVDIENMALFGPDCGDITLSFYVMADGATAHRYKVNLEVYEADGTTVVSTAQVSNGDVWTVPSTNTWDKVTVTSGTNHKAAIIKVRVRVDHPNAFASRICFTRFDLRMGISSDQCTNGDFTTDLSGWSTASGAWAWDNAFSSLLPPDYVGGFATSTNGTDNAELYQDVDVPTAYKNNNAGTLAASTPGRSHVLVRWAQGTSSVAETQKVIVEARASDETVLDSVDLGFQAENSTVSWRLREAGLLLPDDTDHVRVRLIAEGEGASGNSAFDKVQVFFSKFTALMMITAQQVEDRLGAEPDFLWLFNQNSTATYAEDFIAAERLTESGTSVGWASDNTASHSRCLRLGSGEDVEADDDTVFETADESFAVYLEFSVVNTSSQGNLISKCDANGVGWRVTFDAEEITFYVNNGTTEASVSTSEFSLADGYSRLRNPMASQFLFICKKTADGYLDLSMIYTTWLYGDAEVQVIKGTGSVTESDFRDFGDFTNTGVLTLGVNEYTAGAAWENDAVTGVNYIQLALFSGANAEQFSVRSLERLRASKGYRNTAPF